MNRRGFLSTCGFSMFSFLLLSGCSNRNDKIELQKKELLAVHKEYMANYNNGNIELILSDFYDLNCTYVSDSLFGDYHLVKKSLKVMNERHKRRGILPLKVCERKEPKVVGKIGWISCKLTNNSSKKQHGSVTHIYCRKGANWRIVHEHFNK